MKILALLPGAAALDIVHANSDSVISGVNHWTVTGVSKAAICLPSCTVSPLKFTTNLRGAIIKTAREIQLSAFGQIMCTCISTDIFFMLNHSLWCMTTSSLSVRCSFCEGEEEEEEEELWTVTGGLPGTRTGLLGSMSEGTRLMPWLKGVMYDP